MRSIVQFNPDAYAETPSIWIVHRPDFEIRVELPPSFPQIAPMLRVSPILNHPWVAPDSGRVRGHMAIQNWNPNIHLGSVLAEILAELGKAGKTATGPKDPSAPPQLPRRLSFAAASDPTTLERKIREIPEIAEKQATLESLIVGNKDAAQELLALKTTAETDTALYNSLIGQVRPVVATVSAEEASRLLENLAAEQDGISASLMSSSSDILGNKAAFLEAREKHHRAVALKERVRFQQK